MAQRDDAQAAAPNFAKRLLLDDKHSILMDANGDGRAEYALALGFGKPGRDCCEASHAQPDGRVAPGGVRNVNVNVIQDRTIISGFERLPVLVDVVGRYHKS